MNDALYLPPPPPLQILHIVESFSSGCLTAVSTLCRVVSARHCVAHTRNPQTPNAFARLFPPDTTYYEIAPQQSRSLIAQLKTLWVLRRIVRQTRPDIIHCHSSMAGLWGRLLARWYGIPSVYTPHGYAFLRTDVTRLARAVFRTAEWLCARMGNAVAACGKEEYDIACGLCSLGGMHGRVAYIPNVVSVPELDALVKAVEATKARSSLPNNALKAGICGRLAAPRNPALFSVLAEGTQDICHWFWIGADTKNMLAPHIVRTGWLEREDALVMLADLDIYVQTSQWEGLSCAVLEAMALGKPVVATNIPANKAIIEHGVNGFLGDTPPELMSHIRALAADATLRQRIGNAARCYVQEHHNPIHAGQAYAKLYAALYASAKQ